MNGYLRRVATIALAVALSLPASAHSMPQGRERGRDRDRAELVLRVIQTVKRIFGVSTHTDFPTPPIPAPSKP
jgi:hypothetical protein